MYMDIPVPFMHIHGTQHTQCHCLTTSLAPELCLRQPTAIHPKSQLKHASLVLNYAEDYDIESVDQQIHSGTR
jgi:hypothetical protein